jgi:hypothetical protein
MNESKFKKIIITAHFSNFRVRIKRVILIRLQNQDDYYSIILFLMSQSKNSCNNTSNCDRLLSHVTNSDKRLISTQISLYYNILYFAVFITKTELKISKLSIVPHLDIALLTILVIS